MDCIDLKDLFGKRYRVTYEESYYAEHGDEGRAGDPWLQVICCQNGHIYPHGGDWLAASTNRRGAVATALTALECTEVLQDGDDGLNVAFRVEHFEEVAALLKPRRKRLISEAERKRLAEMGRANLERYRQANVEASENERESPDGMLPDSEVVMVAKPA